MILALSLPSASERAMAVRAASLAGMSAIDMGASFALTQSAIGAAVIDCSASATAPLGLALLSRLRADPALALVPIAACGPLEARAACFERGANEFIAYPWIPSEIQARIAALAIGAADRQAAGLARESQRALHARESETLSRLANALESRRAALGRGRAHGERVGHLSAAIALGLGLDAFTQACLIAAGAVHDVGSLSLPDALADAAGLPGAEAERHARAGHEILAGSATPLGQLAAEIALSHHERWDGQGFPLGSRGEAISLASRIAALANALDEWIMEGHTADEAMRKAEAGSGTAFDPRCVAALRKEIASAQAILARLPA